MTNSTNEMFYRLNADGKAVILWAETGEVVTSIDAGVYPVGSSVSARYEHASGIVLEVCDAESIGVVGE